MEPVHQLDVRVAPQLAEDGGALDRLVAEAVELAEQRDAADLGHVHAPVSLRVRESAAALRLPTLADPSIRSSRRRAPPARAEPGRPAEPRPSQASAAPRCCSSRMSRTSQRELVARRSCAPAPTSFGRLGAAGQHALELSRDPAAPARRGTSAGALQTRGAERSSRRPSAPRASRAAQAPAVVRRAGRASRPRTARRAPAPGRSRRPSPPAPRRCASAPPGGPA